MTNEPLEQVQHEKHLSEFKASLNGNRNDNLNKCAIMSFGLAMGNKHLAIAKVESDYTDAGNALDMDSNEIKKTLASALSAAQPFELTTNSTPPANAKPVDLVLAPTYTALEDYAIAHGVPVSAFEDAMWIEGEHMGRPCLKVPHEDKIVRARFLDGEQPKWMPIKPDDMKSKIVPCWYGFNRGIAMATKAAHKTIVICNGQPSVIAAQHHGVAAIAQTDGEGVDITKPLAKRLRDAIRDNGLKVILAYDGDDTGRKSTEKVQKQLIANKIPVRSVQFGGDDHYDLADHCKLWADKSMEQLQRLASYSDRDNQPVLSRAQLADMTHGMITTPKDYIQPGEVLVAPFKSFHALGGFAYLYEPGKMTMVLAPSGGGKTSYMETWQDAWNKKGIDTMFFSPEWSPIALQHRSIQRYSGIPTKAIKLHLLWEREAQLGIAENLRNGINIAKGSAVYNKYLATNNQLSDWAGMSYAFQGQKVTGEILEAMSKQLFLLRRKGRRVGVAFFDYAQLLRTVKEEKGRNSYELICDDIKNWCGDVGIHAFIGSQPTKAVGNACRKGEKILDEYDSHWVRPDAFNLVVTLNIKETEEFDEDGVGTGVMKKEPHGICAIQKNNEGEEGQIKLRTNFSHLAWEDIITGATQ